MKTWPPAARGSLQLWSWFTSGRPSLPAILLLLFRGFVFILSYLTLPPRSYVSFLKSSYFIFSALSPLFTCLPSISHPPHAPRSVSQCRWQLYDSASNPHHWFTLSPPSIHPSSLIPPVVRWANICFLNLAEVSLARSLIYSSFSQQTTQIYVSTPQTHTSSMNLHKPEMRTFRSGFCNNCFLCFSFLPKCTGVSRSTLYWWCPTWCPWWWDFENEPLMEGSQIGPECKKYTHNELKRLKRTTNNRY